MRQRSRHGIVILVLAVTLCGLAATLAQARPVLFARTPHVSQGKIVFSHHGAPTSPGTRSRASRPTAPGWPSRATGWGTTMCG